MDNDPKRTINLIKEFLLSKDIVIKKFYLFGSRSRNDFNPFSDYDFMIVIVNDLNNTELLNLTADIYRTLLKNKTLLNMDLILKTAKNFELESSEIGYLSNTVVLEGIEI